AARSPSPSRRLLNLSGSAGAARSGPRYLFPVALARRLRPYRYQLFLLAYTPLGLFADAHIATVYQQDALGLLTFAVLFGVLRFSPPEQRRQVWLAVVIATCGELYFSLGVGLYRYRFSNVPLYVPAGHGLVYLFALTAAATPDRKSVV